MQGDGRKAVIWDMDGVLVDSYEAHFLSWQTALRAHGRDITAAQWALVFGKRAAETIHLLFPEGGVDVHAVHALKEQAYHESLRKHYPVMPGADDLIASLAAASFLQAIGSSGSAENVGMCAEALKNGRMLGARVDSSQVSRGKPDPEVFLRAAQLLQVPPCNCAVIEDSPVGIEAARRADRLVREFERTKTIIKVSEACEALVSSVKGTPDPFTPEWQGANPWLQWEAIEQWESDGRPRLSAEETLIFVQPDVRLFLGETLEGRGTFLITSRNILWHEGNKGMKLGMRYVSLHAVSRDPSSGYPPCIYAQLDVDDESRSEAHIVPDDSACLDTLFAKMSQAAEMNPDAANEDELDADAVFDHDEVAAGAAMHDATVRFQDMMADADEDEDEDVDVSNP
eukprot:m51a1_g2680 putative had-superfamily hydrolase (399) ;mRNA; f:739643-742578